MRSGRAEWRMAAVGTQKGFHLPGLTFITYSQGVALKTWQVLSNMYVTWMAESECRQGSY